MTNGGIEAIKLMARVVSEQQNCVLELIVGDEGMLAHLIPQDLWEADCEEDCDD